jgi:hypothetical protein
LTAPLLQLTLEDAKNAVEVSRKIHIYMTHKKTLAENLCTYYYKVRSSRAMQLTAGHL